MSLLFALSLFESFSPFLKKSEDNFFHFRLKRFVGLEGRDASVVVTISRDVTRLDRPLTVAYATSDLTARGMDSLAFAECEDRAVSDRGDCGDYLQVRVV